ncbi:MAG: response regulator [Bacteriovoracaceae bacterium]|nr:response regulator [Bacteriovoracaceae bacterium]
MSINYDSAILVVDDMPTMRRVLAGILKNIGFKKIYEAKDGVDALKILSSDGDKIELTIVDWNMPKLNGMDLWRKMKTINEYQHIKFIMVSSENERANIMTALKEGVTNYIVKPFDPKTIKDRIEKVFG